MDLTKDRERLSHFLEGTCLSIDSAIEQLELDPYIDWEDEMLTANMETCLGCGWWMESGDLVHEDDQDTGYCSDCLGDRD